MFGDHIAQRQHGATHDEQRRRVVLEIQIFNNLAPAVYESVSIKRVEPLNAIPDAFHDACNHAMIKNRNKKRSRSVLSHCRSPIVVALSRTASSQRNTIAEDYQGVSEFSLSYRGVYGSTQGGPKHLPEDGSRRSVRAGSERARNRLRLRAQSVVDTLRSRWFRDRLRCRDWGGQEAVERDSLDRSLVVHDSSVSARDAVVAAVAAVAVGSGRLIVEISLDDEDRIREHGYVQSGLVYKRVRYV